MTDAAFVQSAQSNGHAITGGAQAMLARMDVRLASGDSIDVRRFEITERMSGLFEARLVGVSENPDIDFEAAIGQETSCTAHGVQGRTWSGVCADLHQIAVEERGVSTYEVTLVPTLWLATQRRNHRMFQQKSDIDVVLAVLGEWGVSPVLRLTGSYPKRRYRVQYAESDFAFVSRLLEGAGVSFYFDAGSDLVLDDAPQGNAPRAPLPFRDHPTQADREHVTQVRVGRSVRPGACTVRDHDYRRPPAYKLLAKASGGGGAEGRLESFHYVPGAFVVESGAGESTPHADDRGKYRADEGEGASLARRRLEAERGAAKQVTFRTNAMDPAPGTVISMLDHPKSELGAGKRFLVVASRHTGEIPGVWVHTCTASSADAPYRPPLSTPAPRVQGVESATVVGPAGEEIHVDEFGRVRVHFHWDRESQMNERSSCWIHVSQPWGGAGFGATNLPRVGQEVVVDFLGGDPDRPIIVGRVYTNLQKVPYKLPENRTQSGLRSNSTGGGGGYNELMFEDRAGSELLRMQAQKDLSKLVKNDEAGQIGNDRSTDVGNDDTLSVGNDRSDTIGNDDALDVGNDHDVTVGQDETITVTQDQSIDVGQDQSITVGGDQSTTVTQDQSIDVGGDRTRSVTGDEDVTIGGDLKRDVAGDERETTAGNLTVTIGQDRRAEVAMVDSTSVGERFYVEVKPPDDQGDDDDDDGDDDDRDDDEDDDEDDDGAGDAVATSVTMIDEKIVFTTGKGATLTLDGDTVRIEAETIELVARKNIKADAKGEDFAVHAKKDISLRSDRTLHVATSGGAIAIQAKGGDVEIGSDKSVSVDAHKDVSLAAAKGQLSLFAVEQDVTVMASKGSAFLYAMNGDVHVEGKGTVDVKGKIVHVEGKPIKLNC